jgi:hypothetical protein
MTVQPEQEKNETFRLKSIWSKKNGRNSSIVMEEKIIVEGKEKFPRKFNLSFYYFHVLRKKRNSSSNVHRLSD